MKSQSFNFHLSGKIKSIHRILISILFLAKSTIDYFKKIAPKWFWRRVYEKNNLFFIIDRIRVKCPIKLIIQNRL